MFLIILQSLFFFLPAYISNAIPIILEKFQLFTFLKTPIDFGYKLKGNFIFGSTKTFRGIIGGTIGGVLCCYLQHLIFVNFDSLRFLFLFSYQDIHILILGFLLGIGEGLGDLFKSFIKRRLGFASSAMCFPLDQMSFLGAVFLSCFYYKMNFSNLIVILIISPLIPLVANLLAYKIGLKKVWW